MKEFEMNLGKEKTSGFIGDDERFTALTGELLKEPQMENFLHILNNKGLDAGQFMNLVEMLIEDNPNEDMAEHFKDLAETTDSEEFKDKALEIVAMVK